MDRGLLLSHAFVSSRQPAESIKFTHPKTSQFSNNIFTTSACVVIKMATPPSDALSIAIDSCDWSEALVCTQGNCEGGSASHGFGHPSTRKVSPPVQHPREGLINLLLRSEP